MSTSTELKLIPFSTKEKNEKYVINDFNELGYAFAVRIVTPELTSKTDKYKFGVLAENGDLFWFWKGKAITEKRIEAIKIYNSLLDYCKQNSLGKPFAFKPGIKKVRQIKSTSP